MGMNFELQFVRVVRITFVIFKIREFLAKVVVFAKAKLNFK